MVERSLSLGTSMYRSVRQRVLQKARSWSRYACMQSDASGRLWERYFAGC